MSDPQPPDQPPAAVVAAVVFEAPHGTDGFLVTAAMGPAVPFGRGGQCPIRFGYAPTVDDRLARQAGSFVVAADRLAVESVAEPGVAPLQVRMAGLPPVELSRGELYAPGAVEFSVVVRGRRDWILDVRVRRAPPASRVPDHPDDPVTRRSRLELTEHERALLRAYTRPMRDGRLEPATHAEVGAELNYSANKVRGDLYAIWARLVAEGVPVPDYADKRVAVTRAALTNGLAWF